MFFCGYWYIVSRWLFSDEGSLDSPSDHPPMSPKNLQSPDEVVEVSSEIQNGEKQLPLIPSDGGVKIRRYFKLVLAILYIYTKPLIEIWTHLFTLTTFFVFGMCSK